MPFHFFYWLSAGMANPETATMIDETKRRGRRDSGLMGWMASRMKLVGIGQFGTFLQIPGNVSVEFCN